MQFLIAVLVFVVVTLAAFAGISLLDERKAQARVLRDRLAAADNAPDRAPLELAILRDEMLSRIPAFDTLLRRSERVSLLQKMLAQGNVDIRAGNFLMLCVASAIVFGGIAIFAGGQVVFGWAGLLLGFFVPYAYASHMRTRRFQKFEEKFPEAIDTLSRAVRAGHAFTTALEMIANELAEPVAGEFRLLGIARTRRYFCAGTPLLWLDRGSAGHGIARLFSLSSGLQSGSKALRVRNHTRDRLSLVIGKSSEG